MLLSNLQILILISQLSMALGKSIPGDEQNSGNEILTTTTAKNASLELSNFGTTGKEFVEIDGRMTNHLLFRRMVAEAHSMEGKELSETDEENEYDEDEEETEIDYNDPVEIKIHQKPIIPKDEELFPPDCEILYKVSADFEGKIDLLEAKSATQIDKNDGMKVKPSVFIVGSATLFVVVSRLII